MTVSVVIPAFNDERFISQALLSVAGDASVSEIIVIDNNSVDGTVARVTALGLNSLSLIENRENVGAARARHQGVQAARNDYITFLDADDFLKPGSIDLAFGALRERDLSMSLFQMVRVDFNGNNETPFIAPAENIIDGRQAFAATLGPWRIHPMGVTRKSVYDAAIQDFDFHGFFADELLTRYLFLSSSRISGNSGVYCYRYVEKPITFDKVLGQTITNVSVAELGEQLGYPASELATARAVATRALASLAYRVVKSGKETSKVHELLARMGRLTYSRSYTDLKAIWFLTLARVFALFLARNDAPAD